MRPFRREPLKGMPLMWQVTGTIRPHSAGCLSWARRCSKRLTLTTVILVLRPSKLLFSFQCEDKWSIKIEMLYQTELPGCPRRDLNPRPSA